MMKIMRIPNKEKFIEKIQNCTGDVMLNLPDGSECNLKTDNTACQMLRMFYKDNEELDIRLTEPRDYAVMIDYLMRAAA